MKTVECLREFIKNNGYPELYLPKTILIKDKIPTTATGKIDNLALKKEVMLQLGIKKD